MHFNDVMSDESESVGVLVLRRDNVCTPEQNVSEMSPIALSFLGGQKVVNHILISLE